MKTREINLFFVIVSLVLSVMMVSCGEKYGTTINHKFAINELRKLEVIAKDDSVHIETISVDSIEVKGVAATVEDFNITVVNDNCTKVFSIDQEFNEEHEQVFTSFEFQSAVIPIVSDDIEWDSFNAIRECQNLSKDNFEHKSSSISIDKSSCNLVVVQREVTGDTYKCVYSVTVDQDHYSIDLKEREWVGWSISFSI